MMSMLIYAQRTEIEMISVKLANERIVCWFSHTLQTVFLSFSLYEHVLQATLSSWCSFVFTLFHSHPISGRKRSLRCSLSRQFGLCWSACQTRTCACAHASYRHTRNQYAWGFWRRCMYQLMSSQTNDQRMRTSENDDSFFLT